MKQQRGREGIKRQRKLQERPSHHFCCIWRSVGLQPSDSNLLPTTAGDRNRERKAGRGEERRESEGRKIYLKKRGVKWNELSRESRCNRVPWRRGKNMDDRWRGQRKSNQRSTEGTREERKQHGTKINKSLENDSSLMSCADDNLLWIIVPFIRSIRSSLETNVHESFGGKLLSKSSRSDL